jgi:uncharacterized membrane protein
MKKNLIYIILTGLFAAMVTVGTMLIQVPTPTKGYIHIGDTLVYLSGILLGPVYGFLAAAFGSFLADFFSGYLIYAVPTFMIKGLDALAVGLVYRALAKDENTFGKKALAFSLSVALGTLVMVSGYYIYESALYGFKGALIGIGPNIIQGIGGGILALPVLLALEKSGLTYKKIKNRME